VDFVAGVGFAFCMWISTYRRWISWISIISHFRKLDFGGFRGFRLLAGPVKTQACISARCARAVVFCESRQFSIQRDQHQPWTILLTFNMALCSKIHQNTK